MVEIIPANFRDLSYVASRIRPEDREEVEAQVGQIHYIDLAMMHYRDHAYIALVNDNPEAAFGAARVAGNHLWCCWMWGARKMHRAVPEISRFVLREMLPEVVSAGGMRAEARSIATHTQAHRWLRKVGAREQGRLEQFGINGEDFVLFEWTRDSIKALNLL